MDQVTPFYDNAPGGELYHPKEALRGLSATDINGIMLKLSEHIDIFALLQNYSAELEQILPIAQISLQLPDESLPYPDEKISTKHSRTWDISIESMHANVIYKFNQKLPIRLQQHLQQIHQVATPFLKNALRHYTVKKLATRDYLTGLGNRAEFANTLNKLIQRAERYNQQFGLLILDLDRFKQVNDTYGHPEGDKVLICMANIVEHCVREADYAFRLGGDEFCCLLDLEDKDSLSIIAQRIRSHVLNEPLLAKHQVSCSIGSARFQLSDKPDSLYQRADEALYLAKRAGRDRYIAA